MVFQYPTQGQCFSSFMASKSLQFLEKLLLQSTEEIQAPFSELEWHQDEEKKSDLLENFEIFLGYHERNKSNKVRFMLSKIRKFPRLFRICCCKMFTAFDFEFPCKPSAPEIVQVKSEAVKIRLALLSPSLDCSRVLTNS